MLQFKLEDEKLVCLFLSNMETENCVNCEEELFKKIREAKLPVVFDLKEVSYIASMFLSMCLMAKKEPDVQEFLLINVQPNVKKVFKIAGIDRHLTIL